MSWIKNIFIISIVNFAIVAGVVFYNLANEQKSATTVTNTETIVKPTLSPSPSTTNTSIPTLIKKDNAQKPTDVSKNSTSTPNPTPTNDPLAGKCIIFVSGTRYNVTEYRNIHGGGDIFQCGTDMTDIFRGQHSDSYLAGMAKYKV